LRCEEEVKVKKGSKKKIDKKDHDVQIFSWAKVPPAIPKKVQHYVVICDEAHNMQSMDSTRTKDTLSLVLSSRYEIFVCFSVSSIILYISILILFLLYHITTDVKEYSS
jgi:nitrate reductase cytochrome c-type subunit